MTDRETLIDIIEKSLDDGFNKHIPLTSDFLADCLLLSGKVKIVDKTEEKR